MGNGSIAKTDCVAILYMDGSVESQSMGDLWIEAPAIVDMMKEL